MSRENALLAHVADDIRRAVENRRENEGESCYSRENVIWLNEAEKRSAEDWAKEHQLWTDMVDIFNFGPAGPSGSESDTYIQSPGNGKFKTEYFLLKDILPKNILKDEAGDFMQ